MDISVQTQAGPPPLQNAPPLPILPPGAFPTIDSGIGGFQAGQKSGSELAAPLDQGIQQAAYWNSPAGKAAIARSQLENTEATQQNNAALQTPTIPLQQRVLQGTQINSALDILPGATATTKAENAGKLEAIPALTNETIAGANVNTRGYLNKLATTPNYGQPASDNQVQAWYINHQQSDPRAATLDLTTPDGMNTARALYQSNQNDIAQANALDQSKKGAQVVGVSIPSLPASDGSPNANMHRYWNGKGWGIEPTENVQLPGGANGGAQDGLNHTFVQGKLSGQLYNDLGVSGSQNIKSETMNNQARLLAARNGTGNFTADDILNSTNAYNASRLNGQLTNPDGTSVSFPQAVIQGGRKIGSQFAAQPDVQMILKATPNINNAINNFQNSVNAQTGVESVEALNEAGRAFRGAVPTNDELEMLLHTAGLPAKADNLIRSIWNGDPIAPEQKQDYITALQNLKIANDNYIAPKYNNYVKSLDPRLQPYADQLIPAAQNLLPKNQATGGPIQQQNLAGKDNTIPTLSPEDAQKLPSGSQFIGTDGITRTVH